VNEMSDPRTQRLFAKLSHFRVNWTILDREGQQMLKWDQVMIIIRRAMREGEDEDEEETSEADALLELKLQIEEERKRDIETSAGAQGAVNTAMNTSVASGKKRKSEMGLIETLRKKKDAAFMRMLREMDIPLDSNGMVRYADCVFAICRYDHGLDLDAALQAAKFLHLGKDNDPGQFIDSFKVHHALAVRHITSILKQKRAARLQHQSKVHAEELQGVDEVKRFSQTSPNINPLAAAPDATEKDVAENLQLQSAEGSGKGCADDPLNMDDSRLAKSDSLVKEGTQASPFLRPST